MTVKSGGSERGMMSTNKAPPKTLTAFLLEYARRFPKATHISRATKFRMKGGQDTWNERTGRRWTKVRILRLIRQATRANANGEGHSS